MRTLHETAADATYATVLVAVKRDETGNETGKDSSPSCLKSRIPR